LWAVAAHGGGGDAGAVEVAARQRRLRGRDRGGSAGAAEGAARARQR
jgi:hypothetical protein